MLVVAITGFLTLQEKVRASHRVLDGFSCGLDIIGDISSIYQCFYLFGIHLIYLNKTWQLVFHLL